jgi:hypothetical protein
MQTMAVFMWLTTGSDKGVAVFKLLKQVLNGREGERGWGWGVE